MKRPFEDYIEKYEKQYEEMDRRTPEIFEKKFEKKLLPTWKKHLSSKPPLLGCNENDANSFWTMLPDFCFRGEEDDIFVKIHSRVLAGKKRKKPHNHHFFEMTYVYQGGFYHILDGEKVIQPEQSIVLMNPKAMHIPVTESPDDVVFNILFKPEIIGDTFVQLLEGDSVVARFFLDSLYGIRQEQNYLFFRLAPGLSSLIQQIIMEWYDQGPMCRQFITADVLRLFAELSCLYHEQNSGFSRHTQGQDTASTILLYMKQNYATVSIREIAEQFHCSQSAVSHLLKRTYQKTFSELVSEFKIGNACNYLKNSPLSSERIAEIIGYNDLSYFYKVFKKKIGISPAEYRKKYNIFDG